MVACWILGSMKPELSGTSVYTDSAKDLWNEILDRYAQKNIHMLYQFKVDIMHTVQAPACFRGALKTCKCEVLEKFLAGLNPAYEHTKNQILGTEPVASVSKAYAIVLAVETQNEGNIDVTETSVFSTGSGGQKKSSGYQSGSGKWNNSKSKGNEKKVCSHCNKTGRLMGDCFELERYLDWWKGKKNGRFSSSIQVGTEAGQTPLDADRGGGQDGKQSFDPELVQALCQEMMRDQGSRSVISGTEGGGLYKIHTQRDKGGETSKADKSDNVFCDTCKVAKMHLLPFDYSSIKSVACFDLLHMDLWGPYHLSSLTGENYFYTIVDDYSRETWAYLLHQKSQLLYGEKPDYSQLRTMGCLCYSAVLKRGRDKFDARGRRCVLLGLYDLETHEVFHSKDVVFEEGQFPLKEGDVSTTSTEAPIFKGASVDVEDDTPIFNQGDVSPSLPFGAASHEKVAHIPNEEVTLDVAEPTRRSERVKQQPVWSKDYVMAVKNTEDGLAEFTCSFAHALSVF
ncbi:LOW QUALITY PROTEIN: hypothetical protein V2J09_000996 [Rumex salicifolius]